jgi:hypothetical protein
MSGDRMPATSIRNLSVTERRTLYVDELASTEGQAATPPLWIVVDPDTCLVRHLQFGETVEDRLHPLYCGGLRRDFASPKQLLVDNTRASRGRRRGDKGDAGR